MNLVETIRAAATRRDGPLLVALDGRSGTGKSTVAGAIAEALDAAVVDGDDFYSGGTLDEWASRTPAERAAVCIDWRRLRAEALEPLLAGETARWRPFDWESMEGLSETWTTQPPRPVVILDGAYSSRPELGDLVGLSVLFRLPEPVRIERLRLRDGPDFSERWQLLWDEGEDFYFSQVRPAEAFDLVVDAG